MRSLSRRVSRLERIPHPNPDRDLRHAVVTAALALLSTSDLMLLLAAGETEQRGQGLSVEPLAAVERLNVVMESECLRVGYRSLTDFQRRCPPASAGPCNSNRPFHCPE